MARSQGIGGTWQVSTKPQGSRCFTSCVPVIGIPITLCAPSSRSVGYEVAARSGPHSTYKPLIPISALNPSSVKMRTSSMNTSSFG
jgi:hypothetical protein